MDVNVVIPASGESTRFKLPKLFQKIDNRPIISHTIHNFEVLENVKVIVVTMPLCKELIFEIKNIVKQWKHDKVILTEGGKTRHRSIYKGLKCLKNILDNDTKLTNSSVVLIHDGARPIVPSSVIQKVAITATQHKAVGIVNPLVSTVIKVDKNGFMTKSLDRSTHWASEMPQGFLLSVILEAYKYSSDEELNIGTECLKLVLDHCKIQPKILEEKSNLFKITYQEDFILAKNIIEKQVD